MLLLPRRHFLPSILYPTLPLLWFGIILNLQEHWQNRAFHSLHPIIRQKYWKLSLCLVLYVSIAKLMKSKCSFSKLIPKYPNQQCHWSKESNAVKSFATTDGVLIRNWNQSTHLGYFGFLLWECKFLKYSGAWLIWELLMKWMYELNRFTKTVSSLKNKEIAWKEWIPSN